MSCWLELKFRAETISCHAIYENRRIAIWGTVNMWDKWARVINEFRHEKINLSTTAIEQLAESTEITISFYSLIELSKYSPITEKALLILKNHIKPLLIEKYKLLQTAYNEDRFPNRIPVSKLSSIKSNPGYIYLIKSEDGSYKIGKSKNPHTRHKNLSTKFAYQTTLIHTIQASNMERSEKYLHEKFKDIRLNGEWFALTPEDVQWICSLTTLDQEL